MAKKAKKKATKKAAAKKKTTKKTTAKKKKATKKKATKKTTAKKKTKATKARKTTKARSTAKRSASKKATAAAPSRVTVKPERVVEYRLFVEDSIRNLEDQVNYHIKKGWAPVGGVVSQGAGHLMQTMVRKDS
jgi:hypothetical protein